MEIEDLPEDLREMVEGLRHGSNTIECDVKDALKIASDVDDFRERVCCEIDSLIGEAQEVKNTVCKEKVHVVIHLFEGILEEVAVHRREDKAREDYEKRIIEAYGELVDEQHGKDEILMTEAEVVE
uniref:Uncharacterized protein n=1 Tax=viral metagenome TaxID=1070528 RepID=A0A6M3JGI9_9ZZZZ